jgi:hypothetical protein
MPRSTINAQFTYDNLLLLKDAGAVTATGVGQVSASNRILDLGSGSYHRGSVIIDVTAIDIASGDELYRLELQGSTSPSFASGIRALATVILGHSSVVPGGTSSTVGAQIVPFATEYQGVLYRYARMAHTLSGTTPSINYTAYLSQQL